MHLLVVEVRLRPVLLEWRLHVILTRLLLLLHCWHVGRAHSPGGTFRRHGLVLIVVFSDIVLNHLHGFILEAFCCNGIKLLDFL